MNHRLWRIPPDDILYTLYYRNQRWMTRNQLHTGFI